MTRGKRQGHAGTPPSIGAAAQIGLFAVAAAMAWYFVFLRYQLNTEFPLATLTALVDGTAYKPFQFRMLGPWLAGGLASTGATSLLTAYKLFDFAAVLGLFYAFRYLVSDYATGLARELLPFTIFYVLPWNYLLPRDLPLLLPYDLAAVAFFTLGLALLKRHNWLWFYPIFLIGCLNRETMIFLAIVLVAAGYKRLPNGTLGMHVAIMAVIWLVVKFVMGSIYAANPGKALELYHVNSNVLHLTSNVERLITPRQLFLVLSNFGFLWLLIAFRFRKIDDRFARRALWVIPPFVLMILVVGNINEIRVFGELIPIVMLGAIAMLPKTFR